MSGKRKGKTGARPESGRAEAEADLKPEPISATRILMLAALFALIGGFIEVGLVRYVLGLGIPLRVDQHYVWLTPVAHLLTVGVAAGLIILIGRFWRPAATLPAAVGVAAGLATYSIALSFEMIHPLASTIVAVGVGVQLGRMARGRLGRFLVRWAPAGVLGLGLLLAGAAAWSLTAADRAEARVAAGLPPAPASPNILLIILDTVRASSMGLYDPELSNTPGLLALARQGVVFDRAYAPSPWTLPSHATMFTGAWPHQHRADWLRPLDHRYPTLAEAFADHGYATAGFVGNLTWGSWNLGLARGFARYEDYPLSLGQIALSSGVGRMLASRDRLRSALGLHELLNRVSADEVNRRFLRWHDDRPADDRPFFAFLNYFDAHEPVPNLLGSGPLADVAHRNGLLTGATATYVNRGDRSESAFLQEYEANYEAVIGQLDRGISALLDELDRRGDLERTVVIVTSDHGEQIGEHRLFGHTSSLYPPALAVPLLIRYPAGVPADLRVPDEVSLRNLPATILDLVGAGSGDLDSASPGAARFPGRSLARHWEGTGDTDLAGDPSPSPSPSPSAPGDTVFARLTRGADTQMAPWSPVLRGREMNSVIQGPHQYILNGDGSQELYDLRMDPAQRPNLLIGPGFGALANRLRVLLERVRREGAG